MRDLLLISSQTIVAILLCAPSGLAKDRRVIVLGLSRDFDDPRWETHTEVPILTGFSVVSARSGTVAIKTAEEPNYRCR